MLGEVNNCKEQADGGAAYDEHVNRRIGRGAHPEISAKT